MDKQGSYFSREERAAMRAHAAELQVRSAAAIKRVMLAKRLRKQWRVVAGGKAER